MVNASSMISSVISSTSAFDWQIIILAPSMIYFPSLGCFRYNFLAMFDSLPDECKMKQIMYIRTRKIPEYNGHNHEEIIRVKEQQQCYFLEENWKEVQEEGTDMLGSLFDKLAAEAGQN